MKDVCLIPTLFSHPRSHVCQLQLIEKGDTQANVDCSEPCPSYDYGVRNIIFNFAIKLGSKYWCSDALSTHNPPLKRVGVVATILRRRWARYKACRGLLRSPAHVRCNLTIKNLKRVQDVRCCCFARDIYPGHTSAKSTSGTAKSEGVVFSYPMPWRARAYIFQVQFPGRLRAPCG